MASAWRIVRKARAADAFSGEGARQYGGRWNSPGIPIIYASAHQSLAALEILVHLQPRGSLEFVAFRIELPGELITRVSIPSLPTGWRGEPPGLATMQIGDEWARAGRSAVLAVPSAIIPEEVNHLLNPAHPDYRQIVIHPPEAFTFDPRLIE